MKNIAKSLIALFAIVAISCTSEDVQDRPTIGQGDAPVLVAPEDSNIYTLAFETAATQAERFVWSDANYGGDVEVTYTVEIDMEGANFANAQSLGSSIAGNQLSVTEESLNNAVLALGATPFSPASFEVRVKSTLAGGGSPLYSNVVLMTVSPYTTESPKLYVVGNFLGASGYGADWNAADAVAIEASGFGETDFEGYVYMNVAAPEFKLLPTNVDFTGDYGDDGSFSGGLAQEGESNIVLSSPGYYQIKADTESMTYSATPTSWAVTGSATPLGWPDNGVQDYNMTYDQDQKVWTITLALSVGELKFRANDAWDLNYGDDGADGMLNQGGANIAVATAGTYVITLDLSHPRAYTYSVVAQ